MSTVTLPDNFKSALTPEYLADLAKRRWNIEFRSQAELETYLMLLQSTEFLHDQMEDEPDYVLSELIPVETIGGKSSTSREYHRPLPEDNVNNAWSHRCDLVAANPTSSLLRGLNIAIKDNISVGGLPTTAGAFPWLLSSSSSSSSSIDDASSPFAGPISPVDSTVVRRALLAGARLLGTATCEMYSASPLSFTSATGPVHNPHAKGYTSGGSSSGCGSLLGLSSPLLLSSSSSSSPSSPASHPKVHLAIGGDQGGSIRVPASYNGIYGLKPTHGLIPYTGATGLSPMLDHLGPMASDLSHIPLLLQALAGSDGFDDDSSRMGPETPLPSQLPDYGSYASGLEEEGGRKLRVGIITESLTPCSRNVVDTVLSAAKRAFSSSSSAVEVEQVSIPMHSLGPALWTVTTRSHMANLGCAGDKGEEDSHNGTGAATNGREHVSFRWPPDQEMFEGLTRTNPSVMNLIFSGEYLAERRKETAQRKGGAAGSSSPSSSSVVKKALRKVRELRKAYDDALEKYDVLVTPTTPDVAMRHPRMEDDDQGLKERVAVAVGIVVNTCPFNLSGHPAMSVPCGMARGTKGEEDGDEEGPLLPVGMQIIGKRWDEVGVLRAAEIFRRGMEREQEEEGKNGV